MTELRVPRRFNGPPDSANGGYVGGLLAQRLDTAAVTVVLRSPPPLDTPMAVGAGQVFHDTTLVAEYGPGEFEGDVPQAVSYHRAVEAGRIYRSSDTFSSCFVCGSARADGLRIGPGPVSDGTVAAPWTPDDSLTVDHALLWAALDCPGGWSLPDMLTRPAVLGRMTAAVSALPEVGEQCVTVGQLRGESGRKASASTAVYGADGRLLGRAEQVWIRLP